MIKLNKNKNINKNQTIKGERSMALSWQGYDDLILGKIKFSEKDLVGFLEFKLLIMMDMFGNICFIYEKRHMVNLL